MPYPNWNQVIIIFFIMLLKETAWPGPVNFFTCPFQAPSFSFFFFLRIIHLLLILVTPGLCCCLWALSSWGQQRLLAGCYVQASHCPGSFSCGAHAPGLGASVDLGAWASLLRSMWNLLRPGIEPESSALMGRFLPTGPPGKSHSPALMVDSLILKILIPSFVSEVSHTLFFFVPTLLTSLYFIRLTHAPCLS